MLSLFNGAGDLELVTWLPSGDGQSPADSLAEATRQIARRLEATNAVLLHERVYGEVEWAGRLLQARDEVRRELGMVQGPPPTFVQGLPCQGSALAGVHAIAARPSHPGGAEEVIWNGSVAGWWVEGREAQYLFLSDLARFVAEDCQDDPERETESTFEVARAVLAARGWGFSDVCRTWFYLNDILDWYDEFNDVRNRKYSELGLFASGAGVPIPASTGILGRNARGGWCTLDLLAVRSLSGGPIALQRLANPRQNEAPEYGSAFSRGLSLRTGDGQYVLVSGTASIDDAGLTVFPGDFERQTLHTLDTVGALLAQGGSRWEDVGQATVFVKRPEDVPALRHLLRKRGLEGLPIVCAIADICREELLFELDATAIVTGHPDPTSA